MSIIALDHVQMTMPVDEEEAARAFFIGLLGFTEVEKPVSLQGRGGAWFTAGSVNLHVGAEEPFSPNKKAHPAFLLDNLQETVDRLAAAGAVLKDDKPLPGYIRKFTEDPFGNRIELMQKVA
ncbi:Catechol 2,3-dioxygenase [Pseudovibrio ascidiaceicola]|uniref:Catechol 2,3-dioxygenase n=1 Tax=Pseudovibrio ascidiaceicola TaxID=285279 RepID=A0A1I4END3_9HYPH|nr:VOC family protein [Pseudovibrio ascidiaceicola]SFL05671.1 Catechol 2,3-dioxygenase [Pseudovibrio ascidiaceicola]